VSNKLSKSMTLSQFENGYWYSTDLKDFAESIEIPAAGKLRKDELEKAIRHFLKTGKAELPTKRKLRKSGVKDFEKGLSVDLPVIHYTSNRQTKDFIVREAKKIIPDLKEKSGVRYRLNRWREEQLTQGKKISYGDLVKQYIKLNQAKEPFARIPHGRYINFVSDFMSKEKNATRQDAARAWAKLKKMDIPKDYNAWAKSVRR
jgi:SAP domain-containing protein